jgi:superfamily II DNA/RNA helicase
VCKQRVRERLLSVHNPRATTPQLRDLTGGVDVLVATPGRLLDVVDQYGVSLSETCVLVLDEADKLFSPAFKKELDQVLELLPGGFNLNTALGSDDVDDADKHIGPPLIQVCLFSATFPYKTRATAKRLFRGRSPLRISRTGMSGQCDGDEGGESVSLPGAEMTAADKYKVGAVAETITQRAIRVDAHERNSLLAHLAKEEGWDRILCFVNTQYSAERVTRKLLKRGITAAPLHGGLTQDVRDATLAGFAKTGANPARVLVVTDLAGRGLDVKGLPAVVNYDLPRSTADYTHRVGRTGRAGTSGVAVSFVTVNDINHFELIEKRHDGIKLEREVVPGFEPKDEDRDPGRVAALVVEDGDGATDAMGAVPGIIHSRLGLAHDRMHGGVKGKGKSKKDKLREAAARKNA